MTLPNLNLNGYEVFFPAILAYVQLVQQDFHSFTISLYFTISLVMFTASMPVPSSKLYKISLFFLILACASHLSSSLPNMLSWLPYCSCINPLFHVLPHPFQLQILQFYQVPEDNVLQRAFQSIQRFMTVDAGPGASASSIVVIVIITSQLQLGGGQCTH